MKTRTDALTDDSPWKGLFRLGGAAAVTVAVLIVSEIIVLAFYPQPSAVAEWFILFRNNRIVGLIDFWGLEVLGYVLFIPVFLALYIALRTGEEGRMAIGTSLALLGIGIFLATNNPFSMMSLSDQYAAATTDAQKSMFLAAGQTILANTGQRAVGGFNTGLFLVSVAGLIVSWVMLRSGSFRRLTAYVGVVANVLSLVDYVREALAPPVAVTLLVVLTDAVLLIVWFVLLGRSLYLLGRLGQEGEQRRL